MSSPRKLLWLGVCLAIVVAAVPSYGHAQASTFDIGQGRMDGVALGTRASVLEDEGGSLTVEDVQQAPWRERFERIAADVPSFGFRGSAFWIRLDVANTNPESKAWLLEIAYPHLDHVELFVPVAGGFARRATGDAYLFSRREIAYRHFVFQLREPARGEHTYYLRVQSSGSATIPLFAWDESSFRAHQNREQPLLWALYGLVVAMALYNLFIFASVRQTDYLYYCLYVVAYLLTQATLNGHTFQYLLPDAPWLANRMLALSLGLTVGCAFLFIRCFLNLKEALPVVEIISRWGSAASFALALYSLVGSYRWSIWLLVATGIPLNLVMLTATVVLVRRRHRPALFFAAAWTTFMVGVLLSYLRLLAVIPTNVFTTWGIQLGAAIEVVVLSLALADRINMMRRDVSSLNAQLSATVAELRDALVRAQAATKARGEFLATVSHELRTPLNAIINIPPALMSSTPLIQVATCARCHAAFALEADERVDDQTACPECAATGMLAREQRRVYQGDPQALVDNLTIIERSGRHLLEMVNGILDFSKLGAGRLVVRLAPLNVVELLRDVGASLGDLARRSGVELALQPLPEELTLEGDELRLKQVLINLIANAIKFSDGRGAVEVGLREEPGACVVYVRDQGVGIAPENFERIFRTFEQVDQGDTRRFGGTGLGLSISKSLVELHGGRIWVESEPGRGATFFVRLPRTAERRTSVAAE